MSASNDLNVQQFESVELECLDQREWVVLYMFRHLDQWQQMDILRFVEVLLNEK